MAIEKVRFGTRLQMTEEIQDACNSALIPPLLLQPLVENAVTHGIANLPEGGSISLRAQANDGRMSIVVENSFDAENARTRRGGLGLENVRRRLESRYGSDASMRVSADEGHFLVALSLPVETQEVRR